MKRKAATQDGDGVVRRMRQRVADQLSADDSNEEYHDHGPMSEGESDYADNQSTPSVVNTPLTSMSAASTPRKFPSDLKTIKCTYPDCDKAFNRPARLVAHLRSHKNERPYKCTFEGCDKSYIEEKHLKQHTRGSHTQDRDYVCPESGCGKSFLTSTRLRRHQAVHEGQERFRCRDYPPCNQSFRKHQTLQRHIRAEHLGISAFACNQKDALTNEPCEASFDTAATLKRHNEREHGEIRFWCDECGNKDDPKDSSGRIGFPAIELLQKHMQREHINCMFCERVFPTRAELDEHIESLHSKGTLSERKSVPCTWPGCTKTFVKKFNLTVHIRSAHEGQRFVCGVVDLSGTEDLKAWSKDEGCGGGFVTKGNLEDHVRYVHLGMPRPQIGQASKVSKQNNVLGELSGATQKTRQTMPCTVTGCAIKFAQKAELDEHLRTQHARLTVDLQIQPPTHTVAVQGQQHPSGFGIQIQHPIHNFPHAQPVHPAAPSNDLLDFQALSLSGGAIPQFSHTPEHQFMAGNVSNVVNWENYIAAASQDLWAREDPNQVANIPKYDEQWFQNQSQTRPNLEGLLDPALGQM